MATVNKFKPVAAEQGGIGSGVFKLLVVVGLLLALIGVFQALAGGKAVGPKTVCGDCVKVPADFTELKLPRQAGCWEIQLDPNRFSGKVYLPLLMNFALEWELNEPVQIKDRFGNIIDIDSRTDQDLGDNVRNSIFQFKGRGWVRIYIEPRSR